VLRRKFWLFVMLTCLHCAVTLGVAIYAMAALSEQSDAPRLDRTVAEIAANSITEVLMAPLFLFWTPWASQHLPNSIEWLVFVANSALWAAVGVIVITRLSRWRNPHRVERLSLSRALDLDTQFTAEGDRTCRDVNFDVVTAHVCRCLDRRTIS
jgi:hypothetical protein